MIIAIAFISIIIGLIIGHYKFNIYQADFINRYVILVLVMMMISVGIDIERNKTVFKQMTKYGTKILIIPFGTMFGSVILGAITGKLLGLPLNVSGGVSCGLGFYSITTALVKEIIGAKYGALAFITNLFREILAFVLIPIVAKQIGYLEAIATSGSTSMSTSLSIISKSTNKETVIIGIISGTLLGTLIPIMIPIIISRL